MAITVISKLVESIYIPTDEKDAPHPATFTLKALNTIQYMDVVDSMKGASFTAESIQKIARYSFKSAINLTDENGKPAKLDVETLPPMIALELAKEVMNISGITEEEKKISS